MITYITAFILSFFNIMFRAMSQQNVIHKRKALMIPTSWIISCMELFVAGIFVQNFLTQSVWESIILALVIGTAGGLGCMFSLDVHSYITKKIYRWHEKEK